MDDALPELVEEALVGDGGHLVHRYDAILVDEGQDFRLRWWNALRKVLKPGGEMVLVADATQDLYGRSPEWTDEAMRGSGFSGKWRQLPLSHRMPPAIIVRSRDFAERYLPKDVADLPVSEQLELGMYPCELRWVQTAESYLIPATLDEVRKMPIDHKQDVLAFPGVTLLFDRKELGAKVVDKLKGQLLMPVDTERKRC